MATSPHSHRRQAGHRPPATPLGPEDTEDFPKAQNLTLCPSAPTAARSRRQAHRRAAPPTALP